MAVPITTAAHPADALLPHITGEQRSAKPAALA